MRPTSVKLGPFATPSPTKFFAAATIGGAGALTLLTTAVDTAARRILFTSVGNDSGITFTIVGTDWNKQSQTEVVTGANASTAISGFDYLTLTSITASGASAGNVSIGTSGDASTRPVFLDSYAGGQIYIYVDQHGNTQNYTVEFASEDPNASSGPTAVSYQNIAWVPANDTNMVDSVTSYGGPQVGAAMMARLRTTRAGNSVSDYAIAAFTQSLNAPF